MGLFTNIKEGLQHFVNKVHDEMEDFLDSIEKLPLEQYEFHNLPAVPISLKDLPETLLKLEQRSFATNQAKSGLSNCYDIKGNHANGYSYLYSEERKAEKTQRNRNLRNEVQGLNVPKVSELFFTRTLSNRLGKNGYDDDMPVGSAINQLSLDAPEQFSISWTTYYNIYNGSQGYLANWAGTLSDAGVATNEFWPTIARYGMAYNLLIVQKLGASKTAAAQPENIKAKFAAVWEPEWDQLMADGLLYLIDMSIFETLSPQKVRGADRFTPATITLLIQDKTSKALTPVAISVSGKAGNGLQLFTRARCTPFAWIYALQAAKCSITVYGIWLGHVYHWHIVTAALQMTLFNSFDGNHPIYEMLAPQSEYLIPFDDALLLLWPSAAPPTSITTGYMFLEFLNVYAGNRSFYDDDPKVTLANYGISEGDFTVNEKWDCFPMAGNLLEIWDAVEDYARQCVAHFYKNDDAVANDKELQMWITTSGQTEGGNVQGIGIINTINALGGFLASIVYRLSVHGCSRLNPSANPVLTFVANFPPCLQDKTIPQPDSALTQQDILNYLPQTGTIGEMMTFYNTFGFSAPYETFLPLGGNKANLFFPGDETSPPNAALIGLRTAIQSFIERYTKALGQPASVAEAPQIYQWPLCIET